MVSGLLGHFFCVLNFGLVLATAGHKKSTKFVLFLAHKFFVQKKYENLIFL